MSALLEMDRDNGIIECTPQNVAELVAEIRRLRELIMNTPVLPAHKHDGTGAGRPGQLYVTPLAGTVHSKE